MTPTSDERREVAARLRVYSHDFDFGDSDPFWYVAKAAFGDVDAHTYYGVFARLADLIEPQKEGMCCDASDEGNVFECSRCGCVVRLRTGQADAFENVTYGPTLTMPNGRGFEPSFCPHCGARVTRGGER